MCSRRDARADARASRRRCARSSRAGPPWSCPSAGTRCVRGCQSPGVGRRPSSRLPKLPWRSAPSSLRLPAAPRRRTPEAVFLLYLLTIVVGSAFYAVVGLSHTDALTSGLTTASRSCLWRSSSPRSPVRRSPAGMSTTTRPPPITSRRGFGRYVVSSSSATRSWRTTLGVRAAHARHPADRMVHPARIDRRGQRIRSQHGSPEPGPPESRPGGAPHSATGAEG
jgi:hypothetical protein